MHFSWAVALPNLLIGLREGLEAGLVVSILVAAVRRLAPERSLAGVWTGVVGAVAISLSFGAILTFTETSMSSKAQEVFGGALSLLAVVLVTFMVFWMRRTARSLSGELKAKVGSALAMGGTALVVTAFIAVAREGLETALFIWTNTQAAGSDTAPLIGAAVGLLIAVGLCVGMYRHVLKINLARFFTITGAVLVVIAAGVLSYGLGDLQDAGVVTSATAFDLSGAIPSGTWWMQILQGVTNLAPRMSRLQVAAYIAFLATVMIFFLRGARAPKPAPAKPASPEPASPEPASPEPASVEVASIESASIESASAESASAGSASGEPASAEPASPGPASAEPASPEPSSAGPASAGAGSAPSGRSGWRQRGLVLGGVVLVPAVVAGVLVVADRGKNGGAATQKITLSESGCVEHWTAPKPGSNTFSIANQASRAVDIELISATTSAIAAEIEVLGPGTTRDLPVTLTGGRYQWRCAFDGAAVRTSAAMDVTGRGGTAPAQRLPVTAADMKAPLTGYAGYIRGQLDLLKGQVGTLQKDASGGDLAKVRADWLTAHLTWRRMGAAYAAFGDDGAAVDGLAQGLPNGVHDTGFTGFHKIEYDLWHGAPATGIAAEVTALGTAISKLDARLPTFTFDANDVSTRAHEILEDTLRFQLTGQDDYGSGSSMASAYADLQGERVLLNLLAPLVTARAPHLIATANGDFDTLQQALLATKRNGQWVAVQDLTLAQRQQVNAAVGQAVETLSPVPDLLEIQKS